MNKTRFTVSFTLGFVFAGVLAYGAWNIHFQPTQIPAASTAADNVQVLAPMHMNALERERQLRLYLPPGYHTSQQRYAVLYMHDGQNLFDNATAYAGEWGIDEALNTLALSHQLNLIVVGIDHGNDKRITELNPFDNDRFGKGEGDAYLDFIVNQVKPWLDTNYRTLSDRNNTAIMGSSMGGLISHYAAIQHADIFSKIGIFSPAYWTAESFFEFQSTYPIEQKQRLFFLVGEAEGGTMSADFDRMAFTLNKLEASQPKVESLFVRVQNAEHNEIFWRSQFIAAVLWLFEAK